MKTFFLSAFIAIALSACAATVKQATPADAAPLRIPTEAARNVVLNLTGSKVATASKDWEQLKGEWRAAMQAASAAAGLKYSEQDSAARPLAEPGTLVTVHVNDYRYISPGARFGFGVMTGNAFMNATVSFADLRDGKMYGERVYNTSSSAWEGIFSAMTAQQIEAICKEILTELSRR